MVRLRGIALLLILCASACQGSNVTADDHGAEAGEEPGRPDGGGGSSGVTDAGEQDPEPTTDAATDGGREPTELGLSAGCAKAAGATGVSTQSVTVAGKKRTYLRFVPPGYEAGKPMALVLGLHGSGGTSAKARAMFELEPQAAGKAIFLYPQALPSTDPAFLGVNRWDSEPGGDDLVFLEALVEAVEASHCIDRDKVFLTGFSNGAEMTATAACYHGDTFRAIAPLAPGGKMKNLPASGAGCIGEVAVLTGVGTADADHQLASGIVRDFYRTANGCKATRTPTTPAGCEAYDGCRSEVPTTWCTYPGGHAWPPIGASAVWGFFAQFK